MLTEYNFSNDYTIRLYDSLATRQNIYDTLGKLINILGKNDYLILFFSGHGHYDSTFNVGSWIPVDAEVARFSDYIKNTEIVDAIGQMKAKHVLIIADACFSGTFFTKATSMEILDYELEKRASRWALTSGRKELVTVGSTFANCIVSSLRNNNNQSIKISRLGPDVTEKVSNALKDQTPCCEPIHIDMREGVDVIHEQGEFIFHRYFP